MFGTRPPAVDVVVEEHFCRTHPWWWSGWNGHNTVDGVSYGVEVAGDTALTLHSLEDPLLHVRISPLLVVGCRKRDCTHSLVGTLADVVQQIRDDLMQFAVECNAAEARWSTWQVVV